MPEEPLEVQITRMRAEYESRQAIAIGKAAVTLIPGVGAVLQYRPEMEVQRLEEELEAIQADVLARGGSSRGSASAAVTLFLEWSERTKREAIAEKRAFLRRYVAKALVDGVEDDQVDERLSMLDVLDQLSLFDCPVLADQGGHGRAVQAPSLAAIGPIELVSGSFSKLASFGLAEIVFKMSMQRNMHSSLRDAALITPTGRKLLRDSISDDRRPTA
jgi:hypothetical protein